MSINSGVLIVTPIEAANIKKTFERNENEIAEDVKTIREWFKKQPHLPKDEDEDIIRRVLQFNKFSVERTKQKLDYYYAARNFAPEYLQDWYALHPSIQKVHSYGAYVPLPKLTPDFGRVSILKMLYKDCTEYTNTEFVKSVLAQFEIRMKYDNHVHDIIIIDMINVSFAIAMSVHPSDITKGYTIVQKAYSDRIKGIHILNAPSYAMGVINLLKHVLTKKMGERVFVHPNIESLHQYIPKESLPEDYGGNESTIQELHKNWVKYLESKNDWMLKRAAMKSNEKLRIGTPLQMDVFGVEGTFRKINID